MSLSPKDGFPYYYSLAKASDLKDLFSSTPHLGLIQSITEEKAKYRYAPNKWSIKEVIGHMADHERIKMFRAFQLSRNMEVELWGYDQEFLIQNSRFDELDYSLLLSDFLNVRAASFSFVKTLSQEQLNKKGMAREYGISLEEFLRSIIGHEYHHINILIEKYNL